MERGIPGASLPLFLRRERTADTKETLEERLQLFNDCLLLSGFLAAKVGDGWKNRFDIRANGLDLAIPERIFNELARFSFLQILLGNDRGQLGFALFLDIIMPFKHDMFALFCAGRYGFKVSEKRRCLAWLDLAILRQHPNLSEGRCACNGQVRHPAQKAK